MFGSKLAFRQTWLGLHLPPVSTLTVTLKVQLSSHSSPAPYLTNSQNLGRNQIARVPILHRLSPTTLPGSMVSMAPPSVMQIEQESRNGRCASVSSSCTLDGINAESGEIDYVRIINWINHVGVPQREMSRQVSQNPGTSPRRRSILVGDILEVKNTTLGDQRVDFIQVTQIPRTSLSGRRFWGIPYTRARNMMGRIPKKLNEVCMILHFRRGDGRAHNNIAFLVDVDEAFVVRKRNLIFTNAIFPEHSAMHNPGHCPSTRRRARALRRHIEQSGNIFCRWKWTVYFIENHSGSKVDEVALERISAEEVLHRRYLVPEEILCNRWRGRRVKGGSWNPSHESARHAIDFSNGSSNSHSHFRAPGQKYTLFDAFCGAGGVSRGAEGAGFKVTHAVDKSPDVWQTYSLNFPDARLYKATIDKFVRQTDSSSIRVDVLHISPPCQFFSPAHTRPSARDDDNIFAQFSCAELVKKVRPRLVTLEQTFGLTFDRNLPYFRTLLGDLTQLGYSVRWKIVSLCTWGLAQKRRRLIIIAAGPGERLPDFPPATHSLNGENGLRPYTTVRQALRGVRVGDSLHNVDTIRRFPVRRPPLDFDALLNTVCAGLSGVYYPDGTRYFTLREYACLQGFPRAHEFRGPTARSIKSQIGNAFPPSCVKHLYKHLQDWLLREDGMSCQSGTRDIVVLDQGERHVPSSGLGLFNNLNRIIDLTGEANDVARTRNIASTFLLDPF